MSPHHPICRNIGTGLLLAMLLATGCRSPQPAQGSAATPNLGPPMTDARTEAIIQQMEMEYNAAKNSTPTFQGYVEAQKRKEQEQAEAAKKAKEKKEPDPKE